MTSSGLPSHAEPTASSAIDRVADEHFRRELALSPWKQLDVGRGGHDDALDDYSPAGLAALDEACRTSLVELDAAEAEQRPRGLSPQDEVTVHALRERLGIVRELHASGRDRTLFNVIESAPQLLRDLLDILPVADDADWELNSGRLRHFPAALDGFADTAVSSVAAGTGPSRAQVEAVVEQCRTLGREGGHIDRFARQAGVRPAKLAEEIAAGALAAREGYLALADRLIAEVLPSAGEDPSCGREAYALHSRFFLGEEIDVDEAYDWALEDLARIDREQHELVRELGLDDTLRGTFEALDRSPAHSRIGHDALIEWMQGVADEAIASLADSAFDIPEPLRRIECRVQPEGTGVVFYSRPTADFSRPGRMWWSVPAGEEHFGIWRERTTVYHEGAPGHHLQYGIATLLVDELNTWRSQGCWVSGQGEGWALYAEELMADLGFHADPADRLGMLDAQRLRTARVVIDIGVHCRLTAPDSLGGGTWSSEQAKRFLTENVAMGHGSLDFEHLRYMGWPGQAASYRIGARLMRQIRDDAQRRAGADFALRDFHRRVLETGSVGLSTLRLAAEQF